MRNREQVIRILNRITALQDNIMLMREANANVISYGYDDSYNFRSFLKQSISVYLFLLAGDIPFPDIVVVANTILKADEAHVWDFGDRAMRGHMTGCRIVINLCGGKKQKLRASSSSSSSSRQLVRYNG